MTTTLPANSGGLPQGLLVSVTSSKAVPTGTLLLFGLLALLSTAVSGVILWIGLSRLGNALTAPIKEISRMVQSQTEVDDVEVEQPTFQVAEIETLFENHLKARQLRSAYQTQVERLKISEAIARTTEALAHDVRKPFSMFKGMIEAVEVTDRVDEIREILKVSLPEVNQAMATVEGMVQDIMQIGTTAKPLKEPIGIEQFLQTCLLDLFRIIPDAKVFLEYDLQFKGPVDLDQPRFSRVLSNILCNAVQAMQGEGKVWFRTRTLDDKVELVIGNSHSFIPHENLSKLFDAFFTSGKKGGTGLGLAIAKKIVEMHGGSIDCHSVKNSDFPNGMVEFRITLPHTHSCNADQSEGIVTAVTLPNSSDGFYDELKIRKSASRQVPEGGLTDQEAELLEKLQQQLERASTPLVVLIVDDEVAYRKNFESLLSSLDRISHRVVIQQAVSDKEALHLSKTAGPSLIVQDLDLGPASKGGFEIIQELRQQGYKGQICVHSNRFLPDDNKLALQCGAQHVLPKPMSRSHFLKLLSNAAELIQVTLPEPTDRVVDEVAAFHAVVVDDSAAIRISWKTRFKEGRLSTFASPEEFLAKVASEPEFLPSVSAVISDFHFDSRSQMDGFSFAEKLKSLGKTPVFLASDGEFTNCQEKRLFQAILKKQVYDVSTLTELLTFQH
jgi:signal transduction histidine kinase/FixJ family two-component response regulator